MVAVATFVIAVATIVVDCTIVNVGKIVIISTLICVSGGTGQTGFPEFTHLFNKECLTIWFDLSLGNKPCNANILPGQY